VTNLSVFRIARFQAGPEHRMASRSDVPKVMVIMNKAQFAYPQATNHWAAENIAVDLATLVHAVER